MSGVFIGLGGAAFGAAWMYLFDPDRGRRRRSQVRDQVTRTAHRSSREFGRATRDLNNRVHGLTAAAASQVFRSDPADDELLASRVRSRIGRPASHPAAIDVEARDGQVTLRGKVPVREIPAVLSAVRRTPGVLEIDDRLDIEDTAAPVAHTENGANHGAWKPGNRLVGGLFGAGLAAYGFQKSGPLGAIAKVAGLGVVARAGLNRPLGTAVGLNGSCEVEVRKTITIHAPVETVYRFWSNYGNFPRFMSHLEEVRDLGDGRSHWVAAGLGVPIAWNAQTTKMLENNEIDWESERGSAIENSGTVRFERKGENETRITLHMTYKPPAGLLGHTAASILGVDPKHQIDDDMVRMKSLLEVGRTRAHDRTVTRREVESVLA